MLYQPATPSIRALNIGDSTVLSIVWPVLKSLPPIATPWRAAKSTIAGKSQVRLGAPLANGTPSISAAQAYNCDGAIAGSFASIPCSNASIDWCTAVGVMNTSVEAHHTITQRDAPDFCLKSRMSWRSCSARSRLFLPVLTFFPSSRLT